MVKGLKDENAPKRPLSAYIAWQNSVRAKVAQSMPEGTGVADMAKKFGEMWNALSDGQKAPFQKKYKAEMEKFNKKLEKYKTTKEYAAFQKKKEEHKVNTVKKAKFKKDENAPTRPLSAYMLYSADERDDLVADGMSHKDAMSELGKMWGKLSAAKKKTYEDKAAALKAKYTKQVEKYKKTATYKKYQAEKDEFYAQKKADLKKLEGKAKPSKSRSKSVKRAKSRSKSAKRAKSRSKSKKRSAKKKVQKRSRSRSKSKKRSGKKKSRSRN
jgi:hypothetical protein